MGDRELLAAAVEIVQAAGSLAARRFAEGAPAMLKADGSPVTAADTEVERLIRELIAARFPGDGVCGEELEETPGTTGRRWVIDPIDGTTYFTLRIPSFDVLLAVEDEAGTAAAAVGTPMAGEVFYAGRGLGCWRQVTGRPAERVTVSDTRRLRGAAVSMSNLAIWSGDLLAGNGTALASNGHLHEALLDLVRGIPPSRDYEALRRGE